METKQMFHKLNASIAKSSNQLEIYEKEKCLKYIHQTRQDISDYVNVFVDISWIHVRNSIYTFIYNILVNILITQNLGSWCKTLPHMLITSSVTYM